MTTIATDGKSIAADGLSTSDHFVHGFDEKKIRVVNGTVFALAGLVNLFDPLVEWWCAGADPRAAPATAEQDGWAFIVCTPDGVRDYSKGNLYGDDVCVPWAWGTGKQLALGALLAGRTPYEAVEIAAQRDIYTGGTLMLVDITLAGVPKPVLLAAE